MIQNHFKIGKIIKPQGLKGKLKIYSFEYNKEEIFEHKNIFIYINSYEKIEMKKIRNYKNLFIVSINGINDRTTAENLKNKYIFIKKNEISDLFKIENIINFKCYDLEKNYIGKVSNTFNNKANDILIIENKKKEILIPYIKEIYIKHTDTINKYITLNIKQSNNDI